MVLFNFYEVTALNEGRFIFRNNLIASSVASNDNIYILEDTIKSCSISFDGYTTSVGSTGSDSWNMTNCNIVSGFTLSPYNYKFKSFVMYNSFGGLDNLLSRLSYAPSSNNSLTSNTSTTRFMQDFPIQTAIFDSVFENWLKNNVYRKGFKYVFVPEYHEKGNKIHFHGVINKVLTMADSGTRKVAGLYKPVKLTKINKWLKQGRLTEEAVGDVVYNVTDWSFGFSTATVLPKDKKNIILYVTKYIEKDVMGKNKIFGKRYWSSRNVESLPPVLLENVSPDLFGSLPFKEYSSPYNPVKFKYNNTITERIE